jgi:protein O-mannosyl-transferase
MPALRGLLAYVRREPAATWLVVSLIAAAALYASTLGRGLVNYDDPWLVADNWILRDPSWDSVRTVLFDLHSPRRFVLTPEYLPIRDLSIMADFAIWGDWYPGFHITNLAIYLVSIALWFAALRRFGIDRTICAIAVLLWAIHPSHAESVAWITERKGLLAVMFAGACALGYARFRSGDGTRWLALAGTMAVFAVWSKATGAFAIASLVGLELALPALRASWRRALVALAVVGVVASAAFVPVLLLARESAVVGSETQLPGSRCAAVLGIHGFYLRAAAMTIRNSVSYPLSQLGPSALDIVLGAVGLAAMIAIAVVPRAGRWAPPVPLRAGAAIWLFGWLPISHLILPLQMVFVADRYLLFPTLGVCVMAAVGIAAINNPIARRALIATVLLAAALRTLDAQASWRNATTLWERAVVSNPYDGNAWAMYVDAIAGDLEHDGDRVLAERVIAEGLEHTSSPRLLLRQALIVLGTDRPRGLALMRRAAEGGEPIAMSNLALLLLADRAKDEALAWARQGAQLRPNAHAQRTLGKVALAMGRNDEALSAFQHAFELEPHNLANRFNLGLVLVALHRTDEARRHLEACANDPIIGPRARELLASLPR